MSGTKRTFGRRTALGIAVGEGSSTAAASARPFGKRGAGGTSADMSSPAAAGARLARLCRELANLYPDAVADDGTPFFRLQDVREPALAIGPNGVVHLGAARGSYVLRIEASTSRTITIETADDDALLDHIVCHLERSCAFSSAHGSFSALIGRSLEEVARGLILATLCRFHFNRARAAEVLGVSLRTIHNTLTRHCAGNDADEESDIPNVRQSLPEGLRHGDRSPSFASPHQAGEGDQRRVQNQKEEAK